MEGRANTVYILIFLLCLLAGKQRRRRSFDVLKLVRHTRCIASIINMCLEEVLCVPLRNEFTPRKWVYLYNGFTPISRCASLLDVHLHSK